MDRASKHKWFAILTLLGWAIFARAASTKDRSVSEGQVLIDVQNEYGPVLDPQKGDAVQNLLQSIFSRLAAAQEKLNPTNVNFRNKIYIVESPVLNAFVNTQQRTDGSADNYVFITTGLLKQEFSNGFDEGVVRVAGVLAHELGHPLDKVDKNGIEQTQSRLGTSQSLEFKTDWQGTQIAKEASYPIDAVYRGLQNLFEATPRHSDVLSSAASTHPQQDVRLSAQRLSMTADRYENGFQGEVKIDSEPKGFRSDLNQIASLQSWKFVPSHSIEETVERLMNIKQTSLTRGTLYRDIEYNRLLITLDQQIDFKKSKLTSEERAEILRFEKLRVEQTWNKFPPTMSLHDLKERMTPETGSEDFINAKSHDYYLRTLDFYSSPEYTDTVAGYVPSELFKRTTVSSSEDRTALIFETLQDSLPPQTVFSKFENQITEAFIGDLNRDGMGAGIRATLKLDKPLTSFPVEYQIRLASLYHQKIKDKLTPEQQARIVLQETTEYDYFLPKEVNSAKEKSRAIGILTDRQQLLKDPKKVELSDLYLKTIQSIWADRGYYALLDLSLNKSRVDWDAVFAVLKIDPVTGRQQIRNSFKDFTQSARYPEALKALPALSLYSPREAPKWSDSTLLPYILGRKNSADRAAWPWNGVREAVVRRYLTFYPELGREKYKHEMRTAIEDSVSRTGTLTMNDIAKGHYEGGLRVNAQRNFAAIASEIDRANIPQETKQALLKNIFLTFYNESDKKSPRSKTKSIPGLLESTDPMYGNPWTTNTTSTADRLEVYRILRKNGVVTDSSDFFRQLKEDASGQYSAIQVMVDNVTFSDFLQNDLRKSFGSTADSSKKFEYLMNYASVALAPSGQAKDIKSAKTWAEAKAIRDLKSLILRLAQESKFSLSERLELFSKVTFTGPTKDTDEYFRKHILPDLKNHYGNEALLEPLLVDRRFKDSSLQLEIAKPVIESKIDFKNHQDNAKLSETLRIVDRLAGDPSLVKDRYLERLAWRLHIQGDDLKNLIEPRKSGNWNQIKPAWSNTLSGAVDLISQMSKQARLELISHLSHPNSSDLPPVFVEELKILAYNDARLKGGSASTAQATSSQIVDKMRDELERFANTASPNERIPLIENLLTAGTDPVLSGSDQSVITKILGYQPGSQEEILLKSFLDVIPDYERGPTLSFLLARQSSNESSMSSLFEVFQTVGIKFGQLSSIWKLFGDQAAEETKHLKGDAEPLTKAEIEHILDTELTPEERGRILKLNDILGSASLKTVVSVTLTDGREVAVLIQKPNARKLIDSNLKLSLAFLQRLRENGLKLPGGMMSSIIQSLKEQLKDELQMSKEAQHIADADVIYQEYNETLKEQLNGWHFEVPKPIEGFQIRDNLLFVDMAKGKSLGKSDPQVQKEVGRPIVESALTSLFKKGKFNADQHSENFFVDPSTKTIYPIDHGQTEHFTNTVSPFSSDDLYTLSNFIRAADAKDVNELVKFALKMRTQKKTSSSINIAELKTKLTRLLSRTDLTDSDRIIELVNSLADSGIVFDKKFSFGALKGLMVLSGENYVTPAEFNSIMEQKVKTVLKNKMPLTATDLLSAKVRCMRDNLSDYLKKKSVR